MKDISIRFINREDGEFNVRDDSCPSEYLECRLNGFVFLYIHVLYPGVNDAAVFHLTHKYVGPDSIRAMRWILGEFIRPYLRSKAIKRIVGLTNGKVKNWMRIMRLIGLNPREMADGRQYVYEEV